MESLPSDTLLEFNPDTLINLRTQYDLDAPGRIQEAINILQDWISKQEHFVKKIFPKEYLERSIIISKGSVEKAKKKLEKLCTSRTVFPDFFGAYDLRECELLNDIYGVFLPKITKDNYRVYVLKNKGKKYASGFLDLYRYFFMQIEYLQAHDYCSGLILLFDYTEANIMETAKWFHIAELKHAMDAIKEGYGMRVKGLHLLSNSKAIEVIVAIFKQALSQKLASRVVVHKTVDTVYEYIPKEGLPVEYGGKEKSLLALHKHCKDVLSSKETADYLHAMSKACTNEDLRQDESRDHLGIQGSFRTLTVD